jgi:enoyl-CoA hydratase
MEWKFTDHPSAVVVELCSNPVNKQNPEYFQDLHNAFDRLDREFPGKPVVLTAAGKIFCAGIDFEYVFPLFESGDLRRVREWFSAYRATMLRVFTSPRLTVAALNGHTFAGGMILGLCCDFRIAAEGPFKFALNEVPVGIAMPSAYIEILRYRLGNPVATETTLLGRVYDTQNAKRLGFVQEVVPPAELIGAALKLCGEIPKDSWNAYIQTKNSLLHPVIERISNFSEQLEEQTFRVLTSPESVRAQRATFEKLKSK